MSFGKPKRRVNLIITDDLVDEIVMELRMTMKLTPEKIAQMEAERIVPKNIASDVRRLKVKGAAEEIARHLNNGELSEEGLLTRMAIRDLKHLGFEEGQDTKRGKVEGFEI